MVLNFVFMYLFQFLESLTAAENEDEFILYFLLQMANPLTALMYAVQVMNFLKTLIIKTLGERQDSILEAASTSRSDPFDEIGHHIPPPSCLEACSKKEMEHNNEADEQSQDHHNHLNESSMTNNANKDFQISNGCAMPDRKGRSADGCLSEVPIHSNIIVNGTDIVVTGSKMGYQPIALRNMSAQSSAADLRKDQITINGQSVVEVIEMAEKLRKTSISSHINSSVERVEVSG